MKPMTFGEFEKAKPKALREMARECFDRAQDPSMCSSPEASNALMAEAQFYMAEMDRRKGSWIALRDFALEIVVIVLIGGEIMLAIKQGKDEDTLMDKQNGILTTLQKSTADNAASIQALARITQAMSDTTSSSGKTLTSLRSTTETMNKRSTTKLTYSTIHPSI
ncbi:MAG: hypothetical protein ACRD4E_13875 [Bryobacteraceae bacterium]